MWTLTSPDGRMKITIELAADGALSYQVERDERCAVNWSGLGLCASIGDFSTGLRFLDEESASIDERYELPAGKTAEYHSHANEKKLRFALGDVPFVLCLRADNQGAAFRYEIPMEGEPMLVYGERTQFCFPEEVDSLWLQDLVAPYEGPYVARVWDDTLIAQDYGMPALLHAPSRGLWALVSEAEVFTKKGAYCSCHLKGRGNRTLEIDFAPEEMGKPLTSALPFQSPWRMIVLADDLSELVTSTLNFNLNRPNAIGDVSWVRPSRALWAWWEYENGAQLYSESKSYIDIAAAYGLEAVTLDCPWDASCVKALCDYAHARNVQIWIWTGMQRIDTYEKASRLIPLWASWGVDGLKVDFFENDSAHTMSQYEMIAQLMIEHRLMINFHGATKPMGEGRTWPNFMTSEGIMGQEHYKWSNMPDAAHNCTVPFTRNVLGPMDYTPTAFSNANRNTTLAHQLALPVVFESGITHYSLSLYYLEAWIGTDFLRRTRAKYDGLKVLSGHPGDHVAMLRFVKDEWFVGVIATKKRTFELAMDFLPEGEFEAELYEDGGKGEMLTVRRIRVKQGDVLNLRLLENGGAAMYIAKSIGPLPSGVCSGYMSDRRWEYPAALAKLRGGSEPVKWRDDVAGLQLNGSAEFPVTVPETKRYTLRFFYAAEMPWVMKIAGGADIREVVEPMPSSKNIHYFITHECAMTFCSGENLLRVSRVSGAVPGIVKMLVIDNDPPEVYAFGAEVAELTGDAELIEAENGKHTAVGLGYGAEMHFSDIHLPEAGNYILRVDYCAGAARDISFEANGEARVDTYLHPTSGWDFPVWDREEGKEVLMPMREGKNYLRLFNDHGPMSHIRGIALMRDKA